MSSSSVHHQSALLKRPTLLSKTPAINQTLKRTQPNLLNKTVGSKPKHFEIYIDPNHPNSLSNDQDLVPTRLFKPSISATPAETSKNKTKNAVPSIRKKALKPLEDKTNTIHKKTNLSDINARLDRSEQEANDSPSLKGSTKPIQTSKDLAEPTPYNPTQKLLKFHNQFSPPNTKLKLLYRTPTTAKRAPRPPQPLFGSNCDDEDDDSDLVASPVKSVASADTFPIDFNLENVADVEYGPPSAPFESVEYLLEENGVDFSDFFGSLHASRNQLISSLGDDSHSSAADLDQQICRIMEEDGRKDRWISEPICQITSYQGDQFLDDLHMPSPSTRPNSTRARTSSKPTSTSRALRTTASRSTLLSSRSCAPTRPTGPLRTRSGLAQVAGPASMKQSFTLPTKLTSATLPRVDKAPLLTMPARYQDLLAKLVRQDQLLIEQDLNRFLSSFSPDEHLVDCSAWDPQLDQYLLDL